MYYYVVIQIYVVCIHISVHSVHRYIKLHVVYKVVGKYIGHVNRYGGVVTSPHCFLFCCRLFLLSQILFLHLCLENIK